MSRRLSAEELRYRAVTEKQLQTQVEELLQTYGWLYYHAPDNRPINGHVQAVKAGFPDLCAARGTRILFAELKTQVGRQSPAQIIWQHAIEAAGQEYYLWRPEDLPRVAQILSPQWRT